LDVLLLGFLILDGIHKGSISAAAFAFSYAISSGDFSFFLKVDAIAPFIHLNVPPLFRSLLASSLSSVFYNFNFSSSFSLSSSSFSFLSFLSSLASSEASPKLSIRIAKKS